MNRPPGLPNATNGGCKSSCKAEQEGDKVPYISIKELRKIDNYLTKQCELNIPLVRSMTEEDFEKEINEYHEVVMIFRKLYEENEKVAEKSKETMRKHRAQDPEKAKEYNRNYYRRRKEAK